MSADRIWLCPGLNRETWHEIHDSELDSVQYKVSVSAGQNVLVDELFCFVNEQDARQFYEQDVQKREFINHDGSGVGFNDISLYVNGEHVASHQTDNLPR
jgi:hypothetical protein